MAYGFNNDKSKADMMEWKAAGRIYPGSAKVSIPIDAKEIAFWNNGYSGTIQGTRILSRNRSGQFFILGMSVQNSEGTGFEVHRYHINETNNTTDQTKDFTMTENMTRITIRNNNGSVSYSSDRISQVLDVFYR